MSHIAWTFRAAPQAPSLARRAIVAWARGHDADPVLVGDIALAVTEATTNAVVHAYRSHESSGDVVIEAGRTGDYLCVHVRDSGGGLAARVDSPGLGLGLGLISEVSDTAEVRTRETGGTEVVMHFKLGRAVQVARVAAAAS